MVAVPAHRAADVQQQARDVEHGGGDLVGDHFRRMEVAGIEAQRRLTAGGVTHIELVGADGVAFGADAEQLALHGVDMVRRVELLADHLIKGVQQPLARGEAVNGYILHAVRHPDIHHRRRAQLFAKISGYAAAGFAVVDPELADLIVGVRQGKAVGAQRMREAGGVEIQPQFVGFRPRNPVFKVLRLNLIARYRRVGFQVNSVQIETLWPRDQAQRLLKVGAEFFCIARFARVVAGRLDTAGQASRRVFETGDVVTLPAVHGDGQTVQLAQGLLDIHADGGVALLSNFPGLFKLSGHAQSSLVCCG